MRIEKTNDELVELIADSVRGELVKTDNAYNIQIVRNQTDRTFSLTTERLDQIRENLDEMEPLDELTLISKRHAEVAIKDMGRFPVMRMNRGEPVEIDDPENSCKYTLGHPTDEYILFLLSQTPASGSRRQRGLVLGPSAFSSNSLDEIGDDIFSFLIRSTMRVASIRIESNVDKSKDSYLVLLDSILFQFTYNLDISLVKHRHIEEIFRTRRIVRSRRSRLSDLDPPRRKYIPDLVYHYQLGVASDNHLLEYISYYHIAEHFF